MQGGYAASSNGPRLSGRYGRPWGRVLRSGNDERQDADPQQSQRMNVL